MKNPRTFWFTSATTTFGIVIGDDEFTGKRKGYIGVASGLNEGVDEKYIMDWGSPINLALLEEIVAFWKKGEV